MRWTATPSAPLPAAPGRAAAQRLPVPIPLSRSSLPRCGSWQGENGDLAGVLYLGSVPERTTDVHAVLDSLPEQPWQFVADIPADRWVAAPGGGRELYCIFAVRGEDTLFVYEKQDPAYPAQLGKELYGRQGGQPILLLCNGSREDTDTMVTVYCSTGRSLDWNPQLSGSTGQPVQVEGVYDFSNYPLPGAAP